MQPCLYLGRSQSSVTNDGTALNLQTMIKPVVILEIKLLFEIKTSKMTLLGYTWVQIQIYLKFSFQCLNLLD